MTAAESMTYQWDAANRLQSVNGGTLGSYGYDGNGKRGKRKSESGTLHAELRLDAQCRRKARRCFVPSFWIVYKRDGLIFQPVVWLQICQDCSRRDCSRSI
jgi:hypothetical protein